jgi:hypothetical protein
MKKVITLALIICIMLTGSIYSAGSEIGEETMPNFDFKFDPNNIEGSLAKLQRYLTWFTANLDETNIKHFAWGDSIVDNVDATHALKLKFYIPDGVLKVQKLTLNFSVEAFRAYETGAASGGASTVASKNYATSQLSVSGSDFYGNVSAELNHTHTVTDEGGTYTSSSDGGHSHEMPVHEHVHVHDVDIPAHTHAITYGIYESTSAAGCTVYVDGVLRLNNGGAGYSTDQANLDLTPWVTTAGWHYIEISSTQLGRINAAYFIQIYAGTSGL